MLAACDEGPVFVVESDTADTSASKDVAATADLPPSGVPDGVVVPGPNCGPVLTGQDTKGPTVPWNGFTYDGKTYTCNECPSGLKIEEGRWRHIDGKSLDPEVPLDDDYRERFELSGNTWTFQSDGIDAFTNTFEAQTVSGFYFCGDKSEISSRGKVFVATSVSNPGAFGWEVGVVITADLLIDGARSGMLFQWWDGITKSSSTQDLYCRIGSTVQVPVDPNAPEGAAVNKPCSDPFQ